MCKNFLPYTYPWPMTIPSLSPVFLTRMTRIFLYWSKPEFHRIILVIPEAIRTRMFCILRVHPSTCLSVHTVSATWHMWLIINSHSLSHWYLYRFSLKFFLATNWHSLFLKKDCHVGTFAKIGRSTLLLGTSMLKFKFNMDSEHEQGQKAM